MATEESSSETKEKRGGDVPAAVHREVDEKKINAPSMQEIVMLSTICVATLIFWAAGRAACNYHVPGESLTPRTVALDEKTRMPKDVGIELSQALATGDFEIALQLVKGDGVGYVNKLKADCQSCLKPPEVRKKIFSVGTVVQANSVDAIVKVRTLQPGGEVTRIFGIEREKREWRANRVYDKLEDAKLKEASEVNDAPSSIRRADGESSEGEESAGREPADEEPKEGDSKGTPSSGEGPQDPAPKKYNPDNDPGPSPDEQAAAAEKRGAGPSPAQAD